ncbi:MAG: serine hydrolase domain-containing protein, partial [Flammeovirgaceae bacterium]
EKFFVYLCRMRSILILCIAFLACSGKNDPAPTARYFPPLSNATWETATPGSLNWNESAIPDLLTFLSTKNTRAFLVIKDGKLVIENYFGKQLTNPALDFNASSNWYWASAGKTLTSACVGIANAQGKINLDAKTSDYLGVGWTSLTLAQENKITVRNQLTMTNGLDDGVANPDCTAKACLVYKADAGSRWAYHNAPYTLLDNVISSATGKDLNAFVNEEIKSKIGMDGTFIKTGDNNVFYSTARSMARFGLLLLNKGKWDQTQIIPPSYFDLMITTSQNINLSYGYLTWLNGKTSSMVPGLQTVFNQSISPSAPADLFAAMGKNGQLIDVVPSQGLVIIRMGDVPDASLVPFTFQEELWKEMNKVIR